MVKRAFGLTFGTMILAAVIATVPKNPAITLLEWGLMALGIAAFVRFCWHLVSCD